MRVEIACDAYGSKGPIRKEEAPHTWRLRAARAWPKFRKFRVYRVTHGQTHSEYGKTSESNYLQNGKRNRKSGNIHCLSTPNRHLTMLQRKEDGIQKEDIRDELKRFRRRKTMRKTSIKQGKNYRVW